jgi:putative addiction module killer protein
MVEVLILANDDGREPFIDWLHGLRDQRAVARISARIERLHQGLFGDTKSLGRGVYELRVDYGPGYRVYFGREADTVVLLLCGGDKRTQRRDIEQAMQWWERWKKHR